jgi:3-oxoacyl-[acyl-carrier-protein] synthase III
MKISQIRSKIGQKIGLDSFFDSKKELDAFSKGAGFKSVARFRKDIVDEAREFCQQNSDVINRASLVIVVSQHVRAICPPPSSIILHGFAQLDGLVVDINSGCSGFLEGFSLASKFLQENQSAVIICFDTYPSYSDGKHRNVDAVFGEAITITELDYQANFNYLFSHTAWPSLSSSIHFDSAEQQMIIDGSALVNVIRQKVVPQAIEFLTSNGVERDDLESVIVHQGSKFVVDQFRTGMGLSARQCEFVAGEVGNCNSSSIPLALEYSSPSKLTRPMLMVSFGVGIKMSLGLVCPL